MFEFQEEDEGYEPARLEYYNNQRNWEAGEQPRRVIILRDVFTITRKRDTREVRIFFNIFFDRKFPFRNPRLVNLVLTKNLESKLLLPQFFQKN